jgi:hypothetical protein
VNRYFRRVEQFGKNFYEQRNHGTTVDKKRTHAPQDVADPRAKNERHGKMTADKWNQ